MPVCKLLATQSALFLIVSLITSTEADSNLCSVIVKCINDIGRRDQIMTSVERH